MVIGETILDNYYYSESLGTPSKENILSVNFLKKDEYIGTLPVALNISNLSKNVTLFLFIKIKKLLKKLNLKKIKKLNLNFSTKRNIKKLRKIDLSI